MQSHVQKNNHNAPRYRSHHLVTLASPQSIRELLQRRSDELGLLPQVGGQVSVCVADSDEGSLQGVLEGLGRTGGGSVNVVDTSELEETLDGGGGDETSTTGSWDKSDGDGTALARLLGGQRVRKTQVCTPVTTSNRQNAQLGDDDSGTDGSCDFLGGLDTETDVSLRVTNDNDSLESSTLTGTSLLLDRLDLHNLILQFWQEEVHDLVLLDWQRVQVDLLHRLDLSLLDETTKLGNWLPLLLLVLVGAATRSTSSSSTASITTVSSSIATGSESTSTSRSSASGCVSHIYSN